MKFLDGTAEWTRRWSRVAQPVWLLVSAVLVVALIVACGPRKSSETPTSGDPRPGGEPISEQEFSRFLEAVRQPLDPTPLPPMELPALSEQSTSLLALQPIASGSSTNEIGDRKDHILLTRGPANTKRKGAGYEISETSRKRNIKYRWISFSGPSLRDLEVEEIYLRASFQGASRFLLTWGPYGSLGIDVEDDQMAEYTISTDRLPNWDQRSDSLRIGVTRKDKTGPLPEIELERLELLDRDASFVEPYGRIRHTIGREVRESLYLRGGTTLTFPDIQLRDGVRLSFGSAVLEQPVKVRLSIKTESESFSLFDRTVANAGEWQDHFMEVAAGGATTGDLVLDVESEDPGATFYFASPVLYVPKSAPRRVFVYLIDALAANHSSLYGYSRRTTPNIDNLAVDGAWFSNAFSNSSWTREAIPVLMTSMQSKSTGMLHQFARLSEEFVTLQEVFSRAGYATAAFSTNGNAGPARATDQGFDSFFDHINQNSPESSLRTVPTTEVLDWLDLHRDRPTFVYIHTAEPHDPYEPPPPFDTRFDSDYQGSITGNWKRLRKLTKRGKAEIDPRDLAHLVALYDGEVAFADEQLGLLLALLRKRNLLENATVVVTADHGEAFGEHGAFTHGSRLWGELIRIPLIFWDSQRIPKGKRVDQNAQLLDLMPTLLELAGIEVDLPLQGHSLVPPLLGHEAPELRERPIMVELNSHYNLRLSLIKGRWKLTIDPSKSGQQGFHLFDLRNDPAETEDLSREYATLTRELMRDLIENYREAPRYEVSASRSYQISQEQIERLRALGYLE